MIIRNLFSEKMFISAEHYFHYISQILSQLKTGIEPKSQLPQLKAYFYDKDANEIQSEETEAKANNVAIINITGVLTKFGNWYNYGAEDYAQLLAEAYQDDTVKSIIMKWHCVGGSDGAMITLKNALQKRNKPVISVIDDMSMSAAVYIMQFTDYKIAVDEMASIGSIGVMANFTNYDKYYEDLKVEIHEIYPPESNWKNKPIREAKKGNYDVIIEEVLSPWAQHFQKIVLENSPKLDQSVEGILAGRVFYASNALEYGLIDDIKAMDDVIRMAFDYTNDELNKLFNN